jgi:hypothetical protein
MFKFFRKIRQKLLTENKISKYLLYAVGEIILVVIGILIAINLNNANQQKTLKNSVELQLGLLRNSVYQDSISFRNLIKYSENQIKDSQRLILLMNEPLNDRSCEEFVANFNNHIEVRTNVVDQSIYDEMVNSGAFSKIDKPKLKSQIASYYQLSKHFDEVIWLYVKDFREFNNLISTNGTISRHFFDKNSRISNQEQCAYIKSLIDNKEKKQILENYFYTGIDTYDQIIGLYSVLLDRLMSGLPEKSEEKK